MQILFIVHRYYPHIGGIEYLVKSIAEHLAKNKHSIIVLTGEPGLKELTEEEINKVAIIRWPTLTFNEGYHVPLRRSELAKMLHKIVKDVDVIHVHNVHAIMPMYCLNILIKNPVWKVLTPYYHGTGHGVISRSLWPFWRNYIRKIVKKVNVIHVVSYLEKNIVERNFNVKAELIENGVDEELIKTSWKPEDYIMYSGRIEKYKNCQRLVNVVKILNQEFGLNLKLKMFGEGSYKRVLERLLRQADITYELHSFQPFEKYVENLSKASAFALLSGKESYPQTVNEANAIGVPVIVAEPWGINFARRKRVLVINLAEGDKEIASKIAKFLVRAKEEPRPRVPTWNEVTREYVRKLYKIGG